MVGGISGECVEQITAKYPEQWDWLQAHLSGYNEPALTLPGAPAKIKRNANHEDPVSTDEPRDGKGKSEESRGKQVSFKATAQVRTFEVNEGDRTKVQFDMDSISVMIHTMPPTKAKAPDYNHSERVKKLNDEAVSKRRGVRRALLKARLLSKEVELDLDLLPELDEPELGHRRGILKSTKDACSFDDVMSASA